MKPDEGALLAPREPSLDEYEQQVVEMVRSAFARARNTLDPKVNITTHVPMERCTFYMDKDVRFLQRGFTLTLQITHAPVVVAVAPEEPLKNGEVIS